MRTLVFTMIIIYTKFETPSFALSK